MRSLMVVAAAVAVMIHAGCGWKYCKMQSDSAGALRYDKANIKIEEFRKNYEHLSGEGLLAIGHAAGAFQRYPVNLFTKPAEPVADLIRDSLVRHGLDGVEIDVQVDEKGKVFVTHDRIIEEGRIKNIKEFHREGRLEDVVRLFLDDKLIMTKSLYIELKTPHSDRLSDTDVFLIENTLVAVNDTLKGSKEGGEARKRISFVSFNYRALERVKLLCASDPGKYGSGNYSFFWIVASNRGPFITHCVCPAFSSLSGGKVDDLAKDTVLTGIWFDPRGVSDFGKLFRQINDRRPKDRKLCFFISTYGLSEKRFSRQMKCGLDGLDNVRGLIFDIKRPDVK